MNMVFFVGVLSKSSALGHSVAAPHVNIATVSNSLLMHLLCQLNFFITFNILTQLILFLMSQLSSWLESYHDDKVVGINYSGHCINSVFNLFIFLLLYF